LGKIAYNVKASELYGNFANLNSIPEDEYEKYFDEVNTYLKK